MHYAHRNDQYCPACNKPVVGIKLVTGGVPIGVDFLLTVMTLGGWLILRVAFYLLSTPFALIDSGYRCPHCNGPSRKWY
jgi:hypothetical protein